MRLPMIRVQVRYHAADEPAEKQCCTVRVTRISPCADAADAIRDVPAGGRPALNMVMTGVVELDRHGRLLAELLNAPITVMGVGFESAA